MNKLYMLIGLPASGKSTIAKEISKSEDAEIVSSDEIRKELLGDINDQSQNELVFKEVGKRIKDRLKVGNVIYDATNIDYKKRRAFLQQLNKMEVKKIAVLIATPYEECLERNAKRKRSVPEYVIKRMYHNFYIPQKYEGFDDIEIRYNSDYCFCMDELVDIPQDNPHHTLTVLGHCIKAQNIIQGQYNALEKNELKMAGLLHDIGKLKTKTFINCKGEKTDVAHYYNHEKVSAYDSLFNIGIKMIAKAGHIKGVLYILSLIQWHMILHFNMSEKTLKKYKDMLGEEIWNDLEILHKADCEAK